MGISTDGILFYGYHLPEGAEVPWDNEEHPLYEHLEDQWDKWFAYKRGLEIRYGESSYSWDAICSLEESLPVEIGIHCSDQVPMYYIAVKGSVVTASRGYPENVDRMVVRSVTHENSGWDKAIKDFVKEFEIPPPGVDEASEIGWWLASYWG